MKEITAVAKAGYGPKDLAVAAKAGYGLKRVTAQAVNPSYTSKILAIFGANIAAWWKMAEPSGTTSIDSSGHGVDGLYTGVLLGQAGMGDGLTSGYWDGINDRDYVYAGGAINSVFNGNEGSFMAWAKYSGVWVDVEQRVICWFYVDGNNLIALYKQTDGKVTALRNASGNLLFSRTPGEWSGAGWQHFGATWSKSADRLRLYINGAQIGADVSGLSTFSGALAAGYTALGSPDSIGSGTIWQGYLAHALLLDREATAGEMAQVVIL
jgi:hypothetical protein